MTNNETNGSTASGMSDLDYTIIWEDKKSTILSGYTITDSDKSYMRLTRYKKQTQFLNSIHVAYFAQDRAFFVLWYISLSRVRFTKHYEITESKPNHLFAVKIVSESLLTKSITDEREWCETSRPCIALFYLLFINMILIISRELPKAVVMNKSWSISLCYIFPKTLLSFSLVTFG